MLFAYWDGLRGERAAPERADIAPGAMRHVLADTFILANERHAAPAFRLAGTRMSALFGRDLRGQLFGDLWGPGRREAEGMARLAAEDTIGLVVGLLGRNENGSELPLEMLLLPLRHRSRTEARLLGALSPACVPAWAGLVPLRSLETCSLRIVQPRRDSDSQPSPARPSPARRRTMFVVHSGGRA
ncbi:MAG: hypothetical protein JWR86_3301 [Enterovirga sp.]|jgi:hypothetical protein|nr:hypothetical protein [Enterovirga sp.]